MSKYRFRVLDIPSIVGHLADIDINVTVADLDDPQPALVSFSLLCYLRVHIMVHVICEIHQEAIKPKLTFFSST